MSYGEFVALVLQMRLAQVQCSQHPHVRRSDLAAAEMLEDQVDRAIEAFLSGQSVPAGS